MRPDVLFPFFAEVTSLPGVGARIGALLGKLAGPHVLDLLWHLPREVIDRRYRPQVADAAPGRIATLELTVDRHHPASDRRRPHRVTCHDKSGQITLIFFKGNSGYIQQMLPEGEIRLVSGRVEHYSGKPQMAHPDFIVPLAQADEIPSIEPVYPLTAGVTPKVVYKAVHGALGKVVPLGEWLDPAFLEKKAWPAWHDALQQAHNPATEKSLMPEDPGRERLAYDELLANQLALAIMRAQARKQAGHSWIGDGRLRKKVLEALPFALTGSQETSLKEIYEDMESDRRMLRLVQGDVGSGKTVVALLAMLKAVECGAQAALMAPTEILARQHYESIKPLADAAGVTVSVLTGRDKGKARKGLLAEIADGSTQIVIGTHALFQDDVSYARLGLAVVDEQHRFGVHQRLAIAAKGTGVDMLVMTATPIPRTLMMTAYGDLDVSRLMDKPPGRKPIQTVVVNMDRLDEVVAGLQRKVQEGAQVYWVCPLVEESDVMNLTAAEDRFAHLQAVFGDHAVLVHGQMKATEKDAAMERFVKGDARILVATTVIEVGVNVPEATVMVIEHAENFGLAQLHQLRGRIGRGDKASTCILLRAPHLTETARERLKVMSESEDGFLIAEKDLELRGAGEVLGTRQSGLPEMKLADLSLHGDLMKAAYDDARLILANDPGLESDRGRNLRTLLYLFERDQAIANLRSG
ncbi:ATP-dependent DNA helicase RecG [Aestuariispira insulae]|uniref:ATP-dependent DNA helicase RecG n=1 Tax=Aestuariispira insulae TaxID=1461337 RepID=A0A3D9HNI8_9PROT|nr:ATP-dependent DNA helicase RecG [Aestuariispira insulae]RED51070.1 ATP-dependent DNA helicase RecG [Aestuariispira insulae]